MVLKIGPDRSVRPGTDPVSGPMSPENRSVMEPDRNRQNRCGTAKLVKTGGSLGSYGSHNHLFFIKNAKRRRLISTRQFSILLQGPPVGQDDGYFLEERKKLKKPRHMK